MLEALIVFSSFFGKPFSGRDTPHSQGVILKVIDNQCIVKNEEGFGYLRKYPNPLVVFVNY